VRNARVKCIQCNAPAAETTENTYVCVECGKQLFESQTASHSPAGDDD
jgi:peptide methionine sulfoxide reductase MsrB